MIIIRTPNHPTFGISIICLFPWIVHSSFIHNLDVRKERVFRSSSGSYFGYSLSAHSSTEASAEWLVGSPGENSFQGGVYKCNAIDLETGFVCKKVGLSSSNGQLLEPARNGWFGATVLSSREFSLFCSPRAGSQAEGECYISENKLRSFSKVKLLLPRRVCLSGFSATFMLTTKGSLKPFLGGPTCLKDDKPNPPDPLSLVYPAVFPHLDKWYLGYAMTSGMYGIRFEQQEFLVASVAFHINSSFAGKVYLLDKDTKIELESLVGYQPGEHFGASLAVSDFTGDGRDDIVVGAPHHTDYNGTDLKVEIGAVYVFYQTPHNTFNQSNPQELRGQISGSRFGYAVAAIGDTDADGFNDLAIGAPYENEGLGTVYIYHGSEKGLRDNPQIISGKMFSPPLRTFGFAIAGGDFDGNKYSDVVIGAYESAAVVYIPARPIANIVSKLQFVSDSINLQKTDRCFVINSTDGVTKIPVACEDISYCVTYSGLSVEKELELRISIALDFNTEKGHRRILFYENNGDQLSRDIKFKAESKKCMSNTIYVTPGIQDLTSIAQAKMTIEFIESTKIPNRLLPIFPLEYSNIISKNSLSFMTSDKVTFVDATPWWIYVASGLGALLILAIITGVLYKLGFFKRKLPPTEQTDGEELTQTDGAQ